MLTLKVSKNQQVVHCRLLGALHGDTQQLDFGIPCCRWQLLCWCLSRVFSPCVSPAREVEEAEHTVLRHCKNQHWSLTTTSSHSSGTLDVKREAASSYLWRHFDLGSECCQQMDRTLQALFKVMHCKYKVRQCQDRRSWSCQNVTLCKLLFQMIMLFLPFQQCNIALLKCWETTRDILYN